MHRDDAHRPGLWPLGWLTCTLLAFCAACGGSSASGGGSCGNDLPACPATAPTYAQVAPIIQAVCLNCHAPGGVGGRDLTSYDKVYAQRGDMLRQMHACLMPPDGGPVLTDAQRTTLLTWLVCNAPET